MRFISQDRYEKELNDMRHEMEQERTYLQEAEVRMIKNLEETVELSTQRLQRLKQKKVTIIICLTYPFANNELVQLLIKIGLLFLVQNTTTLYCLRRQFKTCKFYVL